MCQLTSLLALYMGAFLNLFYAPVVSETSVTSASGDAVQGVTDPCFNSIPYLNRIPPS
jgi:hypothetical protein